jgi:hypothetical protein
LCYGQRTPSPSYYMLLPTIGTVLVLMFSRVGTVVHSLLSIRIMVGIGLISYSAYLWHQPLFVLTRLNMFEPPSQWVMSCMSLLSLILAWLTWRYVEIPFRSKGISLPIFSGGIMVVSSLLLAVGLSLHFGQGFPRTVFPKMVEDGDVYISYNERIRQFDLKKFSDTTHPKVLVIGNSFGRDVANTLIETGTLNTDGLIYNTDRLDRSSPNFAQQNELIAKADVIVFSMTRTALEKVWRQLESIRAVSDAKIIVFGTKNFGYNPNPYARVPVDQREALRSKVPSIVLEYNARAAKLLAQTPYTYVDIIKLLSEDGFGISVFDKDGNPLSPDRKHLTKYGAILLSDRLQTAYPEVIAAISE